jgi:hypothetical protein
MQTHFNLENLNKRLKHQGIDRVLKWIINKQCVRKWTRYVGSDEVHWNALLNTAINFRFHNKRECFEQLSDYYLLMKDSASGTRRVMFN